MGFLQANFKQGLDGLNRQAVSGQHILLPNDFGRAYRFDDRDENNFYADNIHFTSIAEEHYGRIKSIRQTSKLRGGIYAGAAGLINFSYMGALEASAGILYDVNPYQKIFWDEFISVMAQTPNVEDFKSKLSSIIKMAYMKIEAIRMCSEEYIMIRKSSYKNDDIIKIRGMSDNPEQFIEDWLVECVNEAKGAEEGDRLWLKFYPHLHQMAKNNAIGAITFDVCDMEAGRQLNEFLNEVNVLQNKNGVDYLYTSNIFTFLKGHKDWSSRAVEDNSQTVERAKENLSQILNSKSMLFSNNRIEANYWGNSTGEKFIDGSLGNCRDLVSMNVRIPSLDMG